MYARWRARPLRLFGTDDDGSQGAAACGSPSRAACGPASDRRMRRSAGARMRAPDHPYPMWMSDWLNSARLPPLVMCSVIVPLAVALLEVFFSVTLQLNETPCFFLTPPGQLTEVACTGPNLVIWVLITFSADL